MGVVGRSALRWGLRLGLVGGLAYGVLFGVQEGYEYATTNPRFEVRGLLFESTPHINDASARQLMSIEPGTNILALDLDELASKLVAHPWVSKASVVRVLPDTLEVHVEEHEPAAVLRGGGLYLVGDDGLPFKPLESGERGELPVITGVDPKLIFGDPQRAKTKVKRALEVLETYRSKRRPRLSEIHIDSTDSVILYTAELGSQLRLGRGDVGPALLRYDALRAALGQDSDKLAIAHLDVSVAPQSRDRITASFFPAEKVPMFVEEAQEQTEAKAREHAAREQALADANDKKRRSRSRKSRIPKYE